MAHLWDIILQSFALNGELWRDLSATPDAVRFRYAFVIVILAGLAEALAQSIVLFMNQVKPHRFVWSLFISAVLFVGGYFFYVLSISFVASVIYDEPRGKALLFTSVALAYAPLTLSFLDLIPYFGRAVSIALSAYHVLALLVAVSVTYALAPVQALICVGGAWALLTLLRGTVGRPVTALASFVRSRFAGTNLLDIDDIRERYRDRLDE